MGVRREGASNSGRGARTPQSISERAADALATIARRDAADAWIRTAVLSSVANTSDQLLGRLLADPQIVTASHAKMVPEIFAELAQVVGVRARTSEIQRTIKSLGLGIENNATHPAAGRVIDGIGDG